MSTTAELATPTRFIRLRELQSRVPLSKSRIFEMIAAGAFPKQIKLSARASAWDECEIENWLSERRLQSRRGSP